MTVPAIIAPRLGKLIPRLASNYDGEVVATARAIERLLKSAGQDWHDLVVAICPQLGLVPNTDWRRDVRFCASNAKRLSERELDFITTLAQWRRDPTEKQLKWLNDIADRLRGSA
jgi:hypothetical protein